MLITYFVFIKTTVVFFSDFDWYDLGLLGMILIFLGFLGKINCQDLGEKFKIIHDYPRSWQKNQDYPRLSKVSARKPRRQALGSDSETFGADQRCFSSDSALCLTRKSLKQRCSALIISGTSTRGANI